MDRKAIKVLLAGLSLAAVAWVGLRLGAVSDLPLEWVIELRLPRVVVALAVGAGLAVAGVLVQAVFANPLADPYALGISSAGTLGAVVGYSMFGASALGAGWFQLLGSTLGSFLGCLLLGSIMVTWSRRQASDTSKLLLIGIALGLAAASMVSVWVALTDPQGMVQTMRWLLGDLGRYGLTEASVTLAAVVVLISRLLRQATALDVLQMGESEAETLGVDTKQLRSTLLGHVYVLVGLCVSAAGMIGFIGLVVPHLARGWVGSRHARVLPAAALLGGGGLVLADAVARRIVAPEELPAGVIAALVGAPVFIAMMLKDQRRRHVV